MNVDTLAKHDKQRNHFQVTKAGEVMRIISRDMAIKLYSLKADDVPLIYHVWGEHGISPVASKSELYNQGTFGILVGMVADIYEDYQKCVAKHSNM